MFFFLKPLLMVVGFMIIHPYIKIFKKIDSFFILFYFETLKKHRGKSDRTLKM